MVFDKYVLMRIWIIFLLFPLVSAGQFSVLDAKVNSLKVNQKIVTGADQPVKYFHLLEGKRVGVVANHTSITKNGHLVDVLLKQGITVQAVFAPEHGFRGEAGAGEKITDGKDAKTGLPVRSLYGSTKKPSKEMLKDIDVLLFDMQDVGARFYTYLSTMHYVMEAGAEENIPVIVLDRPNPNGFYTDGPVLDPSFRSFVGMHPIPMVHGMTLGELAQMINGEGWLKNGVKADLTVIPCFRYSKNDLYVLPVEPSPNLPTMESVYLYPSLCLFEPTVYSIGRGTERPFEVFGNPDLKFGSFTFTPVSTPGKAPNPKHKGKVCHGFDVKSIGEFYFFAYRTIYLDWLVETYKRYEEVYPGTFFTDPSFFDKLAGTDLLRKQIESGLSAEDIKKTWQPDIEAFKLKRKPYLLYP